MEIPRVMLGSRFGFRLMPWIVEMATSARWIPYCSLCSQQPFQFLKIIDHNGFYCDMNCIIVFDPIVLRKWRWPLIRCTSIILILPKCTWIVKSSTHLFILPLHLFFLLNIVVAVLHLLWLIYFWCYDLWFMNVVVWR